MKGIVKGSGRRLAHPARRWHGSPRRGVAARDRRRYTWLNSIQAVGIGTVNDDQTEVSYEVYDLC